MKRLINCCNYQAKNEKGWCHLRKIPGEDFPSVTRVKRKSFEFKQYYLNTKQASRLFNFDQTTTCFSSKNCSLLWFLKKLEIQLHQTCSYSMIF